jgi:putative ABC transport system permease protein
MENLIQDVRYGVRMLLKAPGFSIVATIALALGIGANTAMFSVVNAVLLKPLPYPQAEQLMVIWETDYTRGQTQGSASYPDFADWREQNHVFQGMASFHNSEFIMTGHGDPKKLLGAVVNANLPTLLGATPMLGRTFRSEEDNPGDSSRVLLLSHKFFQSHFGGDAGILNQQIMLDGHSYTVIGVMRPEFDFPIQNEPVDFWTTVSIDAVGDTPITTQRGAHYMNVVARLKEGVTEQQAQAEMDTIAKRLEQQYPDKNKHRGVFVQPALMALVGDIRPALLILLGAVGCVLLIACANVANLLLARAMSRQREMAIRAALGASRSRVVRQLLTESILLSLAGGALGLVLAVWWSDLLVALGKQDIPRAMQVGIDWRVLAFTFAVSMATGLVFGLIPALQSSKFQLTESLKEGSRGSEGAHRNRIRGVLVIAELAIAVVLLVGAGLLIKSLWRLRQIDPGFTPQNVLSFSVALPDVRYPGEKQSRFFEDLLARIQSFPGVQSASAVVPLPLGGDYMGVSFETEGRPMAPGDLPSADFFIMEPGYLKTMGIPLIKGRDFNERDQHKTTQVIIVSERFARTYFPDEDPIGKRIKPGISTFDNEESQMREIVGVVGNVRSRTLNNEPRPAYYVPIAQAPFTQVTLVVKTANDPRQLIKTITREVASIDPDLPVFSVKSLDEYMAGAVAAPRFNTTLLSIFASVALLLTIVGLYGVMSYAVAQRTNEIGIRMALGAQSRDVLRLIVGQGLKLVVIGLALGYVGALALTRLMEGLLYGVGARDSITMIVVAAILTIVAILACYLPARRATRIDPLEALRYE